MNTDPAVSGEYATDRGPAMSTEPVTVLRKKKEKDGPDDGYRPSGRRLAHEAYRRQRARRSALIAGVSTLATTVALYLVVVNSPAGRRPGRPSSTPTTRARRCPRC